MMRFILALILLIVVFGPATPQKSEAEGAK